MEERKNLLLGQFMDGYAKYGNGVSLLAFELRDIKHDDNNGNVATVMTPDSYEKLFGQKRVQLTTLGGPFDDGRGNLFIFNLVHHGDIAKKGAECWLQSAGHAGAWLLATNQATLRPASDPRELWASFIHHRLQGDTARRIDNILIYCAFAASVHVLRVDKKNEAHRDDKEPEPAKLTGKTKPTSYPAEPVVQSESQSVKLFNFPDKPIVNGTHKKRLSTAQYNVVLALIQEGGETGLTKDQLDTYSGHGDSRKILKRLADGDSDWESVISFPGERARGYRIL